MGLVNSGQLCLGSAGGIAADRSVQAEFELANNVCLTAARDAAGLTGNVCLSDFYGLQSAPAGVVKRLGGGTNTTFNNGGDTARTTRSQSNPTFQQYATNAMDAGTATPDFFGSSYSTDPDTSRNGNNRLTGSRWCPDAPLITTGPFTGGRLSITFYNWARVTNDANAPDRDGQISIRFSDERQWDFDDHCPSVSGGTLPGFTSFPTNPPFTELILTDPNGNTLTMPNTWFTRLDGGVAGGVQMHTSQACTDKNASPGYAGYEAFVPLNHPTDFNPTGGTMTLADETITGAPFRWRECTATIIGYPA